MKDRDKSFLRKFEAQIAQDFVKRSDTESESTPKSNDDFLIKVALQFPDELWIGFCLCLIV